MAWMQRPALLWDPQTASGCYWEPQDWHCTMTSNADDDDQSSSNKQLVGVSYQQLLTMAAVVVAKLREELAATRVIITTKDELSHGVIPIVVAIPEGPWLPLAILVVHGLNRPFVTSSDDTSTGSPYYAHAILVPLEPREAIARNRHILQDIQPSLILAVPGLDMDRIQNELLVADEDDCQVLDFSRLAQTALVLSKMKGALYDFWGQTRSWDDGISLERLVARGADFLAGDKTIAGSLTIPDDLRRISHIVYTSGTTGRPKGCISSLASLQHYLQAKNEMHSITGSSVVLLASGLSFDPCLSDILATFHGKATLALAPGRILLGKLGTVLTRLQVTHVLCTPTVWGMVHSSPAEFPSLQVVALGGEPIPPRLCRQWARSQEERKKGKTGCRLFATYGVTEACVYQTAGEVFRDMDPSGMRGQAIGKPFLGIEVRICQEEVQDVLIDVLNGQVGEVVLAGSQMDVLTGYWKRPDLAHKFVAEADGNNQTVYHYRTGDRGVRQETRCGTGTLRVLGRIVGEEGMVKVNGVRVELGGIEAALVDGIVGENDTTKLSQPPTVVESCMTKVVTGENENSDSRSEIHAYCVLGDSILQELGLPTKNELPSPGVLVTAGLLLTLLRARCSRAVNAACMPTVFVILPRLPLSPTGKRDRKGLPNIGDCQPIGLDDDSVPLKGYGTLGTRLADALCECLNLQPVQRDMLTTSLTFDMIGGDSLAAARVVRAIYAFHNHVFNSRFVGGEHGKFEGAFDVTHLLRASSLGDYVDMLERNKVGGKAQKEDDEQDNQEQHVDESVAGNDERRHEKRGDVRGDGSGKPLYESLLEAVTFGRPSIAIALLHAGADPSYADHGNRMGKVKGGSLYRKSAFYSSPMHLACTKGHDQLVEHLLFKGSKHNSPDASGLFPIHLAASGIDGTTSTPVEDQKRLNIVKHLLGAGCPWAMRDANKQTVLHAAARSGHSSIFKYIIHHQRKGGNEREDIRESKRFINWLDRWFRSPVHWAVLNGRIQTLEIVLELGCTAMPYKPKKAGKYTSAATESPMELCDRLYPADSVDATKRGKGERVRELLQNATANAKTKGTACAQE